MGSILHRQQLSLSLSFFQPFSLFVFTLPFAPVTDLVLVFFLLSRTVQLLNFFVF